MITRYASHTIRLSLLSIIACCLLACQPRLNYPVQSENNRTLNPVLTLDVGDNIIYLQDYILQPNAIDSLTCTSDKLICTLSENKQTASLTAAPDMEYFADVKVWVGGVPYSVPCKKSGKVNYTFTFNPLNERYNTVKIFGQMNNWDVENATVLKMTRDGFYETTFALDPGNYTYRLLLDNEQVSDPSNPRKVDDGTGDYNSIIHVSGENSFFPCIYTDQATSTKVILAAQNEIKDIFVYWQNYLIPVHFSKILKGKIVFDIPAEAREIKRSFIRVFVTNDYGMSNDILVPLHYGKVVNNNKQLQRNDKHAQVIYYALTDRFHNGDTSNDAPLNSPEVHEKADFHGGDLSGIRQKIEEGYFQNLGITTICISPPHVNPQKAYSYYKNTGSKFSAYHGFWPVSFSQVDKRFGSNEELKELVEVAHKNNLNLIVDYVINRMHEEHPLYKEHPEFATPLNLPDGSENIRRWNKHPFTSWFDSYLPTLDLRRTEVAELMSDSVLFWINEYGVDGFRFDLSGNVPADFWSMLGLKAKMRHPDKNIYQLGESMQSHATTKHVANIMLDGQPDHNLSNETIATFAGAAGYNLVNLYNSLRNSLDNYGHHHLMINNSGNNTTARFIAYASGDLQFDEDAALACWTRDIQVSDSIAYNRLFLLHTLHMTIPGIPLIYYGDEVGLTGASAPDSHRMLHFNNLNQHEQHLLDKVAKLANLRQINPALSYGDFINIDNKEESWVYARKFFEKESIIFINNSGESRTFEVELPVWIKSESHTPVFETGFSREGNKISIEIPAYSAEILV